MTTEDTRSFDAKKARLDDPSGWLELTRYQTVRLLIDALLESSPDHKFNKSELERRTGMSREAIREHLPRLVELGVIEEIEEGGWPEYQLNSDGKVTKELFELNSAVNSVLAGEPKEIQPTQETEITELPEMESGTSRHDKLFRQIGDSEDLPENTQPTSRDDDLIDDPSYLMGA